MMAPSVIYPNAVEAKESDREYEKENGFTLKSLGFIPLRSKFRKSLIKLIAPGSCFDSFVLAMILVNSISMACVDYHNVDDNYFPDVTQSFRNKFIERAELLFIIIFIIECIMKVIAYGFVRGECSYLRDNWNRFDFIILMMSILSMLPLFPNLSALRSFRVLRPLKSISKLPGLKKIIDALVDSISDLANVMFLMVFLLTCFSITGVLLWNGLLHARCRLTPYPVKMQSDCRNSNDGCWEIFIDNIVQDPSLHRCLPYNNNDNNWTQSTSQWFLKGEQDCIWPIDVDDERVCSIDNIGYHSCPSIRRKTGGIVNRTCGSNYDSFGNPRFINSNEPYGYPRMKSGTFIEGLNWGFTNYDSFLSAFFTTFQIITLEGWTDIMYQVIDTWYFAPTVAVFSLQVILCGYIALNLVLAVIAKSLDNAEDERIDADININLVEVRELSRTQSRFFGRFIDSKCHSTFIMICIIFNTVILSMDYYEISDEVADRLETLNVIFTLIFSIDVIACNISYGIKRYWSNAFNCFDGIIGIVSLIELILMHVILGTSDGPSSFSIFRSLRLFRVFKLAKNWKSLQSLLKTIINSIQEIGNFAILLFLFIFIYALVGMQILSNRLHFDHSTGSAIAITEKGYFEAMIPRSHFDNFLWSMVTVFQILSGENWNTVMYEGLRARGWIALVYFFSLMIVGVFIVMNMFLAILLKRFENNEDLINDDKLESIKVAVLSVNKNTLQNKRPSTIQILWSKIGKDNPIRKICFRIVDCTRFETFITCLIILSSVCLALDKPLADPNSPLIKVLRVLDLFFTIIYFVEMLVKIVAHGFLFEKGAYLRSTWNQLDCAVVFVSILNLANLGPGKALRALRTLRVLRPLRMVNRLPGLKVVVDALLQSFPAVGNVAVLCLLFFLIFASFGVNFLKGTFYHCNGDQFNILSSEQIDYLINPFEWGYLNSTQKAWFDVGSLGCKASSWIPSTIPTSREICDCLSPGDWVLVVPQNFNNVFNGMALLFEIASTEGWVDVMHAAIDQRGVNMQPIRDNNSLWAIFFIVFLVIGAFFVLELFVGVTIDNFNRIQDTGRSLMTDAQKQWASTQAFVMKIKPEKILRRPEQNIRALCYDFTMNTKFRQGITICILGNSICTAIVSFGDTQEKLNILEYVNSAFATIFTIEAILYLIALKMTYFEFGWNRFDFAIVCGSNISFVVGLLATNTTQSITTMIRLFRICRLVRLIKSIKKLRTLFNTMIMSIPSIANIGALAFLLFFMYSVVGMQLYSFIPESDDLNEHANFRSFGATMLLLLRFSTGENWNGFMRSMIPSKSDCDPDPIFNATSPWCVTEEDLHNCTPINGCGAGFSTYVYFYSFTLLVTCVVLNLFIGIVLDAFENCNEGDILSPKDLEHFTKVWAQFDPDATWKIKAGDIKLFLSKLDPPLGTGTTAPDQVNKMINNRCLMDIPVDLEGKLNIVHVASHLAKRLAIMKQGDAFNELSDDHPIQKQMRITTGQSHKTLSDINMERAKKKLNILRAFVKSQVRQENEQS